MSSSKGEAAGDTDVAVPVGKKNRFNMALKAVGILGSAFRCMTSIYRKCRFLSDVGRLRMRSEDACSYTTLERSGDRAKDHQEGEGPAERRRRLAQPSTSLNSLERMLILNLGWSVLDGLTSQSSSSRMSKIQVLGTSRA